MAKILLDYAFPVSLITPTPAASTAFLKQVGIVVKPKSGQEGNVGNVYECTTMTQVAARTDNVNAQQLFNAGMSRVFVVLSNDLDLQETLENNANKFWTLLVSDDFTDEDVGIVIVSAEVKSTRQIQDIFYTSKLEGEAGNDISIAYTDTNTDGAATVSVDGTGITVSIESSVTTAAAIEAAVNGHVGASALVTALKDVGDETDPQVTQSALNLQNGADEVTDQGDAIAVGTFDGVIGYSTDDADVAAAFCTGERRVAFVHDTNGAKNMCYAFGVLLSNQTSWNNQQYITMPFEDGVDTLGQCESLFEDKVSFVISDDEFGNRLGLFAAGGKAIVAPYIYKNLMIDLQSKAVQWISANQPDYTLKEATLLENRLQEDIINERYIDTGWINEGTVEIKLLQDNFVASGFIDVAEPKAMWRVFSEMRATL